MTPSVDEWHLTEIKCDGCARGTFHNKLQDTQKSVIIITKRDIQTRDDHLLKHDLCVCVILISDSHGLVRLKADNCSLSLKVIWMWLALVLMVVCFDSVCQSLNSSSAETVSSQIFTWINISIIYTFTVLWWQLMVTCRSKNTIFFG